MSGLFDSPIPKERSSLYENMCRQNGDDFDRYGRGARAHCEDLWADFRDFADPNFKSEFALHTHARWFEMYVAVSLARARPNINPKPEKRGPDVLVELDGRHIWIEATSVTPGKPGLPDSVPPQAPGRIHREPVDQYVLRIRNALEGKQEKFRKYIESGVVHPGDINVIAINVFEVDGIGPYIRDHFLRSLYGRGDPVIKIDRSSGAMSVSNANVVAVQKASGADVGVQPFIDASLEHVTAVLGSHASPFNRPSRIGDDFVLYPNLTGGVAWPKCVLGVGDKWCFSETKRGWKGTCVAA